MGDLRLIFPLKYPPASLPGMIYIAVLLAEAVLSTKLTVVVFGALVLPAVLLAPMFWGILPELPPLGSKIPLILPSDIFAAVEPFITFPSTKKIQLLLVVSEDCTPLLIDQENSPVRLVPVATA